jgi:hypothetical protein
VSQRAAFAEALESLTDLEKDAIRAEEIAERMRQLEETANERRANEARKSISTHEVLTMFDPVETLAKAINDGAPGRGISEADFVRLCTVKAKQLLSWFAV